MDPCDAVAIGEFHARPESEEFVDFGGFGENLANEAVGIFEEDAGGIAGFRIVHDPAITGIARVFSDAGE